MKREAINAYLCRVNALSPYRGSFEVIRNSLGVLQQYVGGAIQTVPLADGLLIICNDDGKILGFPVNRAITNGEGCVYDIVVGNALVVRVDGEEFASINEDDIQLIEKYFPPVRLVSGNVVELLEEESLPEWNGGS